MPSRLPAFAIPLALHVLYPGEASTASAVLGKK